MLVMAFAAPYIETLIIIFMGAKFMVYNVQTVWFPDVSMLKYFNVSQHKSRVCEQNRKLYTMDFFSSYHSVVDIVATWAVGLLEGWI